MNKLYAAQYLHVFGLGEIIGRLKRKGYDIKTKKINDNTSDSHVKYVLKDFELSDIIPDLVKCLDAVFNERPGILNTKNA